MSGSVSMVDGHIDPDKSRMTDKKIIQILNTATNIDGLQICCIDYENNPENATYLSIKSDIVALINRQQAEIERLKAGVNVDLENYASEYDSKIKAEAIKEFAERYKTLLETELHWCECADEIIKPLDNLVKEMVSDDK